MAPPVRTLQLPVSAGRLVVLAPHPDDETLGAGGLIHDAARAGWVVSVVIATDASRSHPDAPVSPGQQSAIRTNEAVRACGALGVSERPIFLGFPDGELHRHGDALTHALVPVLDGADLVIAPRIDDWHSDHVALAQANGRARPVQPTWSYAIWAWSQLSSAALRLDRGGTFEVSRAGLDAKRRALAEYPSQTTDLFGAPIVGPDMLDRTAGSEVFWDDVWWDEESWDKAWDEGSE